MSLISELLSPPVLPWIALAVGLVVGSFANVCIHRLPRGESILFPRSRCPACGAAIGALDNVPIASYLLLRGRCRACRARISPRYPLVEAVNGAMYFLLAATLGATPRAVVTMAFVTALVVLSLIDLEHHLLPDAITLPGVAVGLAASFLPGAPAGPSPLAALAAAAGGYLMLAAVATAYLKLRGIEGLGRGDWKMAAMLGAFLGWPKMMLALFLATVSGTLVGLVLMAFAGRTSRHPLPLGTFLGMGALLVVFAGDRVLQWYRGLLGA